MSRRHGRPRPHRLALSPAAIAVMAAAYVERHAEHLGGGFRLMGTSAVWARADGRFTARFVYRKRRPGRAATITYTLRGLAA